MSTGREQCPLCRVQTAEVVPTIVPGGDVRAGLCSYFCPRCTRFILHDDARELLDACGQVDRDFLSRQARSCHDSRKDPLEITRSVVPRSCYACGHSPVEHELLGAENLGMVARGHFGSCTLCSCERYQPPA